MGKPNTQPQFDHQPSSAIPITDQSSTSSINHFSHPHPLQLSNNQSQQAFTISSCSGCKLEASGMVYSCTICNYFLHQKCSQMPQQITHPFDQNNHALSLLPNPAYPEGIFSCDACKQQGNGFSYHCQVCGIDLHILCASMPMVLTHQAHHHQLYLTFSPPYPNQTFSCDICRMNGYNNWLYRCSICEFDVHLTCVNSLPASNPAPIHQSLMNQFHSLMSRSSSLPLPNTTMQYNNILGNPTGYSSFRPNGMAPNSFMMNNGANYYGAQPGMMRPPAGYGQQPNTMMDQIVGGVANGIASGASQAAAQALIQGMFSGSGGGGGGGGGGGANDVSAFSMGADVIPADGGFNQMDGGYDGGDVSTTY
ncbi:hypothetical protein ACH5RR_000656 [Cinchona calisaya]|uniref:Zinc finger PHD-type domain-containing protein n=1 Tax=Cinchona calisaya TaxID=153742 RepID=A0ABD3B1R7_9GENT